MKNKVTMNIGISLFLCMFLILCLVVFAVLSLVTANSHWQTTNKSVEHTEAYYSLSEAGEYTLQNVEDLLLSYYEESDGKAEYETKVEGLVSEIPNSTLEGNQFSFRIEEEEQELYVELEILYPGTYLYRVVTWSVQPNTLWQPDMGIDVL